MWPVLQFLWYSSISGIPSGPVALLIFKLLRKGSSIVSSISDNEWGSGVFTGV